jgi:hypothetical protein
MRFMAIIAFCLIAIMALVKKIEPAPVLPINDTRVAAVQKPEVIVSRVLPGTTEESRRAPVTAVSHEKTATTGTETISTRKETAIQAKITVIPDETIRREEVPVRRETLVPDTPVEQNKAIPEVAVDSSMTPPPVAEIMDDQYQQISQEASQETEPSTLTFRFDSDGTFLHLIATSSLLLYASTADGFIGMDSGFNLVQSKPAGELYEVMPRSLPRKITSIFEKSVPSPVYLVALPSATRRDLRSFLDGSNPPPTGALVIHRDGRISNEI